MAKLRFTFGTMGSAKSLDLIRTRYNYIEKGMHPIVFKPSTDTREGSKCIIKSRVGIECPAQWIYPTNNIFNVVYQYNYINKVDIIFIDEVQFCTKEQILQLSDIATKLNIPVCAYGLKNNFRGELFEPICTLIAYADELNEIKGICHCGKKANHNARIVNNKIVKDGEEVQIGGNESYIALCNKCYKEEILK